MGEALLPWASNPQMHLTSCLPSKIASHFPIYQADNPAIIDNRVRLSKVIVHKAKVRVRVHVGEDDVRLLLPDTTALDRIWSRDDVRARLLCRGGLDVTQCAENRAGLLLEGLHIIGAQVLLSDVEPNAGYSLLNKDIATMDLNKSE